MEDFIFHEGRVAEGYQPLKAHALFNKQEHLQLQAESGWQSFSILNKKYKRTVASIHFHIQNNVARSPLRSPFASVEISEVTNITLFKFLEFVTLRLKEIGIERIVIKNPCAVYQSEFASLLQVFLFNLGYQVSDAEVSAVIHITKNDFAELPDTWERRKLKQSTDADLKFEHLSTTRLKEVYDFILNCRNEKGYSLSMSYEELHKTVEQFPEHYILFCVMTDDTIVAASISIKVTQNILYNFYSAHSNAYNHVSPVVMLVQGMYAYCQQKSFSFLDLGTSAIEGKPNFNLLDFKLRLGAKSYAKLTFEKIFV